MPRTVFTSLLVMCLLSPRHPGILEPAMVLVKGGVFFMGDSLGNPDERPVHQVVLSDFYIGKTEVTLVQFKTFVQATGYRTDTERGEGSYVWTALGWVQKSGVNWRHDEKGALRPDTAHALPVLHVSWNDAARYCNWLSEKNSLQPVYIFLPGGVFQHPAANGYRLPTEAEWEYAASGGSPRKTAAYSGSDNLPEVAWYAGNAQKGAHPVGRKKANALGLYDCSGNVWEWCQDWYAADYYALSRDTLDSSGPVNGAQRTIRGGSWSNNPRHCRISNRSCRFPDARDCNLGFRVARNK